MSLLVIVPTRARKAQCERLIKSFEETADSAELIFAVDADDESYEGMDWAGHRVVTMNPRPNLVQKLNNVAVAAVKDGYDHVMWTGDDHEFVTRGWDTRLLDALDGMGGSGWVYPDNGRRRDVPETWLASADVIEALGWYANPNLSHYYIDNSVAELAKRAGLIRYVPDVVIRHRHYSVDPDTPYDGLYQETEAAFGQSDMRTFTAWRASNQLALQVSVLRRAFNPDVQWVLSRI